MASRRFLPAVGSRVLRDIAGRLKFVAKPLSEHIEQYEVPQLTFKPEKHKFDAIGEVCGMTGIEAETIIQLALVETTENEMLAKALRDFMMIGKMLFSEESSKAKANWDNAQKARAATDKVYQSSLASYNAKIGSLTFKWNEVDISLHELWSDICIALIEMINEDNNIETMNHRDVALINIIDQEVAGAFVIEDNRITSYDENLIRKLSNQKLDIVLNRLANTVTATGRF